MPAAIRAMLAATPPSPTVEIRDIITVLACDLGDAPGWGDGEEAHPLLGYEAECLLLLGLPRRHLPDPRDVRILVRSDLGRCQQLQPLALAQLPACRGHCHALPAQVFDHVP